MSVLASATPHRPSYQWLPKTQVPVFQFSLPVHFIMSPTSECPRKQSTLLRRQSAIAHAAEVSGTESVSSLSDAFNWRNAWYPAAIVSDLDPKVPTPITILGYPMVIWWDKNTQTWSVLADKCPHRLAPLSEGRIHESGQIQCSYHGWTFGADGGCGLIPQSANSATKNSPRACATVVPSVVHQELLFVWPDQTEGYMDRAARAEPPFVPEISDPSFSRTLGCRDVSYGADTLMENLTDPAHVPFAHHNIKVAFMNQGKRESAKPLEFQVTSIDVSGFKGVTQTGTALFTPPCLFNFRFNIGLKEGDDPAKAKKVATMFYCVPTTPGHARFIYTFANNFAPKILNLIPLWFRHLGEMLVLDSDMYFLHMQERRLEALGGSSAWTANCFVPTSSDAFVTAYRTWFNRHGGSSFDWPDFVDRKLPPTPPKEQLMDRYKSHVVFCKSCRGAKRNFELLQTFMAVASFLIVASMGALAAQKQILVTPSVAAILVVLSGVLALVSHNLGKWIHKMFHFHDYCHGVVV